MAKATAEPVPVVATLLTVVATAEAKVTPPIAEVVAKLIPLVESTAVTIPFSTCTLVAHVPSSVEAPEPKKSNKK